MNCCLLNQIVTGSIGNPDTPPDPPSGLTLYYFNPGSYNIGDLVIDGNSNMIAGGTSTFQAIAMGVVGVSNAGVLTGENTSPTPEIWWIVAPNGAAPVGWTWDPDSTGVVPVGWIEITVDVENLCYEVTVNQTSVASLYEGILITSELGEFFAYDTNNPVPYDSGWIDFLNSLLPSTLGSQSSASINIVNDDSVVVTISDSPIVMTQIRSQLIGGGGSFSSNFNETSC